MYNVNKKERIYQNMLQIGNKLKELRKAEGLTQQEVADKLNISRVNYTRYETDVSRPDYETLIAIAEFYEITLDELFGRR
jgi:transcriptional regulator with XRE-family HTH domain